MQREQETALLITRTLAAGNRDRATQLLKVVKNFRAKISTCEGKLANVEQVLESLADAQALRQHVDALKSGAAALKVRAATTTTTPIPPPTPSHPHPTPSHPHPPRPSPPASPPRLCSS